VVATGEMGELGIAPHHAPLITRLKPGQVRVLQPAARNSSSYVSGGILEVQPQVVTILTDTAIRAKDLDEAAALRGQGEAERMLADRTDAMEVAQAQAAARAGAAADPGAAAPAQGTSSTDRPACERPDGFRRVSSRTIRGRARAAAPPARHGPGLVGSRAPLRGLALWRSGSSRPYALRCPSTILHDLRERRLRSSDKRPPTANMLAHRSVHAPPHVRVRATASAGVASARSLS
jgi:ATP synthase F1 epsilon subunit